jgi:hypothetical protein
MNNIIFIIKLLLTLIFIVTICTIFFNVFIKVPQKYKLIYNLNHPHYISGAIKPKCPQGCYKNKCTYPNHCFSCKSDDPYCCCNDEQCKDC